MTMHKALHPKDDIDRLYMSRKEGGRGLSSIESSDDVSIQRLEYFIEKRGGRQPPEVILTTRGSAERK